MAIDYMAHKAAENGGKFECLWGSVKDGVLITAAQTITTSDADWKRFENIVMDAVDLLNSKHWRDDLDKLTRIEINYTARYVKNAKRSVKLPDVCPDLVIVVSPAKRGIHFEDGRGNEIDGKEPGERFAARYAAEVYANACLWNGPKGDFWKREHYCMTMGLDPRDRLSKVDLTLMPLAADFAA